MISVVIRNKNQERELSFLLKNLTERYSEDVSEIIVIDNLSTDGSKAIAEKYNVKFVSIENFSYGGSANFAAAQTSNDIVVIFSAHAYPVSHDFFKLIKEKFSNRLHELAGLRCLHNDSDYKGYINKKSSLDDYNGAGLIFCGSAFNKKIWEKHPFKSDVQTFEDKEWSKRVLKNGYKIEFVPSIFCYQIKRNKAQHFFRYKNEVIGSYQLHNMNFKLSKAFVSFFKSLISLTLNYISDVYYAVKKIFFLIKFNFNKPKRFE